MLLFNLVLVQILMHLRSAGRRQVGNGFLSLIYQQSSYLFVVIILGLGLKLVESGVLPLLSLVVLVRRRRMTVASLYKRR